MFNSMSKFPRKLHYGINLGLPYSALVIQPNVNFIMLPVPSFYGVFPTALPQCILALTGYALGKLIVVTHLYLHLN